MSPTGPFIWAVGPQLVALFGGGIQTSGGGT